MILGTTGHRLQKLYGFKENDPGNIFVIKSMGRFFKEKSPKKVLTGMAIGVDQWAAQWCLSLDIPFVAVVPAPGQEKRWPQAAQEKYHKILAKASDIWVAEPNPEGKSYNKILQKRNQMIVDNADQMLAVYGGGLGGTRNCLEYARQQKVPIQIINPGDYYLAS